MMANDQQICEVNKFNGIQIQVSQPGRMRNLINMNALIDHLIRPPKFTYSLNDLGPCIFELNGHIYERIDFSVQGRDNMKIQASMWRAKTIKQGPSEQGAGKMKNEVLIYLHCNCGSRVEAMQFVNRSLELGYSFVAYDSQGCGHSQGSYISLGYHEMHDLQAIMSRVDSEYIPDPQVVLWGRSMGAVTTINYLISRSKYVRNVKVAVLDSPFVNLKEVICEIVNKKIGAPKMLVDLFVSYMEPMVEEKAGFKISDFDLRNQIFKIKCPLILMASKSDGLVPFKHLEQIYDAHRGRKSIFYLSESHTDQRSTETVSKIFKAISRYYISDNKSGEKCPHSAISIHTSTRKFAGLDLLAFRSSELGEEKPGTAKKPTSRKKLELTYPYSSGKLENNYTDFSSEKTRTCIEPATEQKKKKLSLNHSKSNSRVPGTLNSMRTTIHLYARAGKQDPYTPMALLQKLTQEDMSHKKIISNFADNTVGKEPGRKKLSAFEEVGSSGKENHFLNFRP